jgi:hypothetical protein
VTTTPGNVADYDYIREQVNRDRGAFEVAEIAYDPWNSSQLVTDLMNDGAELVSMRQGFASMSGPAKELQRLMLEGTPEAPVLRHGGNPCVRWLVDNLAVAMNPRGKREARQGPRRGKDRRGGGSDQGCGPSHARLPTPPLRLRRRSRIGGRVTGYAVLLVALVAVVAAGWLAAEHVAAARLAVRSRVVVNLYSGQAVSGVLWCRRGRYLVLRQAELMEPGNTRPAPMDGEAIVDRDQVLLVQRLES